MVKQFVLGEGKFLSIAQANMSVGTLQGYVVSVALAAVVFPVSILQAAY